MKEEDKKLLLEMKDNCLNASVYDDENRLLKANAITNVLKEIERLNKDRNKLYENGLNDFLELQKKRVENERLNNIIKEVREYIEPIVELDNDIMLKGKMLKPVLEILDKTN